MKSAATPKIEAPDLAMLKGEGAPLAFITQSVAVGEFGSSHTMSALSSPVKSPVPMTEKELLIGVALVRLLPIAELLMNQAVTLLSELCRMISATPFPV